MSPKNRCTRLGLVTGPIVTLALLALSGCSGEPSADAGTAESVGAADQIITEEEIAELRNSSISARLSSRIESHDRRAFGRKGHTENGQGQDCIKRSLSLHVWIS